MELLKWSHIANDSFCKKKFLKMIAFEEICTMIVLVHSNKYL